MIICITGIDGSGKTLQATRLVERLNAAGYPASYVWTGGRAYLSRPLIWAAKRLLKAPRLGKRSRSPVAAAPATPSEKYRTYLASTERLFKRPWVRTVWQHVSLVEHSAEILAVTLPHLLRGRIVVCDRYIYDSLLGIAVLANVQPQNMAQALALPPIYAVPMPTQWFFLDVPAQTAFARRNDVVDVEFLQRRAPLYHAMAQKVQATVLDGTATPDVIEAEIWNTVEPLLARGQRQAVG